MGSGLGSDVGSRVGSGVWLSVRLVMELGVGSRCVVEYGVWVFGQV